MPETSLYKKILKELTILIEENKQVPNYKLPSERALAIKFNSSRPPIRCAYKQLLEQGLIEVVHGKGYYVKNNTDAIKNGLLPPHLLFIAPSISTNFMQRIRAGMTRFCETHNVELSLKITDDSEKTEKKLIESVLYSKYDGLILFPVENEYYNEPLLKLSIAKYPIVIIDRYIKNLNLSFVSTDNHTAMTNVVKYLHGKKYKNLVYVTTRATTATTNEDRINGYNSAMIKYYGATLASNLLLLKSDNRDYVYSAIKTFLQENPQTDALIINGVFLSAAYVAISELNLKMPDDLRLVIFDNESSFAERKLTKPIIIEQEGESIGYLAAKCVYNQIMGNKRIISKQFPVKIITSDG